MRKFILILFMIVYQLYWVDAQNCTVKTQNGNIYGAVTDSLDSSRKICSYTAIPYAAPPLGRLRFKAPQPARPWGADGLNATSIPNWCPQGTFPPKGVKMSEDCLYLNVHVPVNASTEDQLPVMIWIHGGGFTGGSTLDYPPTRLLARGDVIYVSVQYRLGLLGFLSTGDASSPGNYGLKDQAYAIRWVSENIKAFGGDPDKVTVFGQSAGGASTVFQLITPLNKGRINGVIAQSGSALSFWSIDRNPQASAKLMARRLGCPDFMNLVLVECLRIMPWEVIVTAQTIYALESYSNLRNAYATMIPVVEPPLPGAFIARDPAEIIKSGEIPDIPVMLGATKHDGSFLLGSIYLVKYGPQKLDQNPDYMRNSAVPELLKFLEVREDGGNRAVASSTEMLYLGGGVNRSSFNESMPGLVDMMTVFAFKSSILNTAELLAKNKRNVYLYSFEHHSSNSMYDDRLRSTPVAGGIAHADELICLFNFPKFQLSKEDSSFSDMFTDMWLNFVKTGNPTPVATDMYEQWPTYNASDESFMKLNNTPKVLHDYRTSWRPNGFQWS